MDIHECKQCGSRFVYCRKCVFKPVRYKDAGFCSKECYEASKKVVEPVVEIEPIVEKIETVEVEEIIVENNNDISVEDTEPIEEKVSVEVETPIAETTTVEESTIKKETNTYKNKKNKYKYTSSY